MSYSQKCKRRASLHKAIANLNLYDMNKVLEISTKSNKELGVKLSALNLTIPLVDGTRETVEKIYQESKVFDDNHDIVEFNPSRQLNTQARAAAIWNTLYRNNMIYILKDKDEFKKYYKSIFKW